MLGVLLPSTARASVLDTFFSSIQRAIDAGSFTIDASATGNLQTMNILEPAMNLNPAPATGGGGITIADNSALVPEEGPSGTIADIEKPKVATVSTYIVRSGDTVLSIAQLFGVSKGTILSANDLTPQGTLQIGQKLIILPVTGIDYTVQKGDTVESIAKKLGGDAAEITAYNDLVDTTLVPGTVIIVPNAEASAPIPTESPSRTTSRSHLVSGGRSRGLTGPSTIFANNPREPAHNVGAPGTLAQTSYYIPPLAHYVRTQGIHGYNAVDLAAPIGTPIVASASGDVVVAKEGGWNGGYGNYVVISHDNGSQTLYAHMSKVATYDGARVVQGQVIGYVGETGEATGPHVHFEIRNGIRNPF